MKIKRLELCDYRNFRGRKVIDFTDPLTGEPLRRAVLVGSNGSGKTTVLEAIAALVATAGRCAKGMPPAPPHASITIALRHDEIAPPGDVPGASSGDHDVDLAFSSDGARYEPQHIEDAFERLAGGAGNSGSDLRGGILFFPHIRLLPVHTSGMVAEPIGRNPWAFRYEPQTRWDASLDALWVHLDNLDAHAERSGDASGRLAAATHLLTRALGAGREVRTDPERIRVEVEAPWTDETGRRGSVLLSQLSSGEQQVVLLLGEIARRRRPGAILMVDEPELSLHPSMQRLFLGTLENLARELDWQVILATHSPEIVHAVAHREIIFLDYLDEALTEAGVRELMGAASQ